MQDSRPRFAQLSHGRARSHLSLCGLVNKKDPKLESEWRRTFCFYNRYRQAELFLCAGQVEEAQ